MKADINEVSRLLKLVDSYVLKRKEIEKVYENSGILYNIFDVLKLSSSEVRLHSSILASLLGASNHGAKSAFLKEFLRIPALAQNEWFVDLSKVIIEVEKYIGPKTETTGGRIDLFLTDGKKSLIIENKIYAYDQENQILRYHNYKPDAKLIYLTLFGDKPSKESLGGLSVDDIICLSYKDNIIPWLNRCVQLASNLPYVRETINQYINTLKHLTNSYMTKNDDIINILGQPENINAAFAIRDNLDATISKAINVFLAELKEKVAKETPFICVTEEESDWLNQSYLGFQFEHRDWQYITFSTEYERTYLGQMAVGLLKKPNCENIQNVIGAKELADRLGYTKSNASWFWGYPTESFAYNWYNPETISMLLDGRMVEWFVNTLNLVDEQSKGLDL